jgi:hypothetical protein
MDTPTVDVSVMTRLLNWSSTWTVTGGLMATPATAVVGCWLKARWSGAATSVRMTAVAV